MPILPERGQGEGQSLSVVLALMLLAAHARNMQILLGHFKATSILLCPCGFDGVGSGTEK
jgi:hypothetical protein